MRLNAILLEQEQEKRNHRKVMLEASADFWSEFIKTQNLPLTESARQIEYKKLQETLVKTVFMIPLNQHDEFKKIFEMGITKENLNILTESEENLYEILGSIKEIWNKFKGVVKNVGNGLKKLGKKILEGVLSAIQGIIAPAKEIIKQGAKMIEQLERDVSMDTNSIKSNESLDVYFNSINVELNTLLEADYQRLNENDALRAATIKPMIDSVVADFPNEPIEIQTAKVAAKVKEKNSVDGALIQQIILGLANIKGNVEDFNSVTKIREFSKSVGLKKLIKDEIGSDGIDDVDFENEYDLLHSEETADRVRDRMFRDKDYIAACKKLELDYTEPENAFMAATKKQKWSILLGLVSVGLTTFTGFGILSVTQLLASTLIPLGLEYIAEVMEQKNMKMSYVDGMRTAAKWIKRIGMAISIANIAYSGWNWFMESGADAGKQLVDVAAAAKSVDPAEAAKAVEYLNTTEFIDATTIQMMTPENQVAMAKMLNADTVGKAGEFTQFIKGLNPDVKNAMDLGAFKDAVKGVNPEMFKVATDSAVAGTQAVNDTVDATKDVAKGTVDATKDVAKGTVDATKDVAKGTVLAAKPDATAIEAVNKAYMELLSDPNFKAKLADVAGENIGNQQKLLDILSNNAIKPENADKILSKLTPETYEALVKGGSIDKVMAFSKQIGFDETTLSNLTKYAGDGKIKALLDTAAIEKISPDKIKDIINTAGGEKFISGLVAKDGLDGFLKVAKVTNTDGLSKIIDISTKAPGTMDSIIAKGLQPEIASKLLQNDFVNADNVANLVKNDVLFNSSKLMSTYNIDSTIVKDISKIDKETMNSFLQQAADRNSSAAVVKNALASGELKTGMTHGQVTAILDTSKNSVAAAGQATELISGVGDSGTAAIKLAVPAESVEAAKKIVQGTAQQIGEKLGADVMKEIDPDKLAKYIAHNMENPNWFSKIVGSNKLESFENMANKIVEIVAKDGEIPDYIMTDVAKAAKEAAKSASLADQVIKNTIDIGQV
jgi:hypothetical protein